jgi:hypothetical protein
MKMTPTRFKKSESGMATVEAIPLLVIFVIFVAYGMGFFGSVHTAILNSIAARTFAFETFRNRTNLTYYRDFVWPAQHYRDREMRFHGIQPEQNIDNKYGQFAGTGRPIAIGLPLEELKVSSQDHNAKIFQLEKRNTKIGVNPIWVKVAYGICLTAACGEN